MSIEQYKDKNRAELWEIVQIQAQDSIEQNKRITELETLLVEAATLVSELVEKLKEDETESPIIAFDDAKAQAAKNYKTWGILPGLMRAPPTFTGLAGKVKGSEE